MTVAYEKCGVTVHHGDCLDVLPTLPDQSVHAVVCDPPYELAFMGRAWDSSGIAFNPAVWRECLRVLKPGGHLLAFGGSRTWHRLACAIEDAGFELRDSIAWLYGSGFPKSLDVSKAIDKVRDDRDDILRVTSAMADAAAALGVTRADIDAHMGTSDMGGWWLSRLRHRCQCPKWDQWLQLKELLGMGHELDAEVWRLNGRKGTPGEAWSARPITQEAKEALRPGETITFDQRSSADRERRDIPATPAAQQWAGWGTALKPGFEPIVVARKPLSGTVSANVLTHGTGALNIDGCRVDAQGRPLRETASMRDDVTYGGASLNGRVDGSLQSSRAAGTTNQGRWPTNVVLDSDTADALDAQSGPSRSRAGQPRSAAKGDGWRMTATGAEYDDEGGASRFFPTFRHQAKAPTRERPTYTTPDGRKIAHPTVKPLALMRWLVRLVTPPAGVVLDPFAGSGSTLEAALLEDFRAIGVEREESHLPLIGIRLDRASVESNPTTPDAPLVSETLSLLDLLDDGAA